MLTMLSRLTTTQSKKPESAAQAGSRPNVRCSSASLMTGSSPVASLERSVFTWLNHC
jgi:hypothetical protein